MGLLLALLPPAQAQEGLTGHLPIPLPKDWLNMEDLLTKSLFSTGAALHRLINHVLIIRQEYFYFSFLKELETNFKNICGVQTSETPWKYHL